MVGKVVNFNPRSREGSDDCCRLFGYLRKNFNPRSREGSDILKAIEDKLNGYFNPRSREGSDTIYSQIFTTRRISIRAPARGATFSKRLRTSLTDISIRAPARGATM